VIYPGTHLGCCGCQQKLLAPVLNFQTGSSGGGLLGGGDGSCCGSLLRCKQELQAADFLFWTGNGSGLLGCYVGDSLLVFPSAVRGDGGSFSGAAFPDAAMATVRAFFTQRVAKIVRTGVFLRCKKCSKM
jgi:hypothetical protein